MTTPRQVALVAEHDTWISLDPVIGCPASCAYCYLGTLGLRGTRPQERASPKQAAKTLRDYLFGRRAVLVEPRTDGTPLCIRNYTDMLMTPRNRMALAVYVEHVIDVLPNIRPIVLITKGGVPEELVRILDSFDWPIIWFFSQSFARDAGMALESGRVADFETTLRNAGAVTAAGKQAAVHFWRPFVRELAVTLQDKELVVSRLKESGMSCSVVVGLKNGPGVPADDPRLAALVPSRSEEADGLGESFDRAAWRQVATIARGLQYPLYRHSSCAIALNRKVREYLGTWRSGMRQSRCLPCSCPARQRGRCGRPGTTPDPSPWHSRLCEFLELDPGLVAYDGETGRFHVDADVSEFDYNTILHAANGYHSVSFRSVIPQKAWPGPW